MARKRQTPTNHPRSGVSVDLPEDVQDSHRSVIAATVNEVKRVLDEALALAEAEQILVGGPPAPGRRIKALTKAEDNLKTPSLKLLISQHHPFMVQALERAGSPERLTAAIISTKEDDLYIYPQEWWEPFFSSLAAWGSMRQAVKSADVSYHQALVVKAHSPIFRLLHEMAMAMSVETLEDEAKRRALGGSDILLIFMLKGAAPEKYRDRVELTSPSVVKKKAERLAERLGLDPEELMKLAEEIAAEDGTD